MYGGYEYHSGYLGGMYGSHGSFYGVTPLLAGLFSLVLHLLFFLLVISLIAAVVVFVKKTLLDNPGVLAPAGIFPDVGRCFHCQAHVKQTYVFCPACGASLASAPVKPVEKKIEELPDDKVAAGKKKATRQK